MTAEFFVPGIPRGRDERVARGHVYTTPQGRAWRNTVRVHALKHRPETPCDGPMGLSLTFYLPRPKSHYTSKGALSAEGKRSRLPLGKPDGDNLTKPVLDALHGVFYRDDAQIVSWSGSKWWADTSQPGVCVQIEPF